MAQYTVGSAWTAIGGPSEALTVRNTSTEMMEIVLASIEPPLSPGASVDLWRLRPNEGASLRTRYDGLTLWARTVSGASAVLDAFKYLMVVAGEGFHELDPVADGIWGELLSGGIFSETTDAHWTKNPENGAIVTHAADGLTMTPGSTAFDDRAQILQGFTTKPGQYCSVKVVADQVPSSESCVCLVFDADGGSTLIHSQYFAAAGELNFDFSATSTITKIYLRVHNTISPAHFLSASVKGVR